VGPPEARPPPRVDGGDGLTKRLGGGFELHIEKSVASRQAEDRIERAVSPKADRRRYRTAVHEAGHAVIAIAERLPFKFVTITPPPGSEAAGMVRLTRCFSKPSQEIRILLAGMEAERQLLGWGNGRKGRLRRFGDKAPLAAWFGPDRGDHSAISDQEADMRANGEAAGMSAKEIEAEIASLKSWQLIICESLVKHYRPVIEAVALALMERGTLSYAEVKAIFDEKREG
jgi:ATP-dependent Zn protease